MQDTIALRVLPRDNDSPRNIVNFHFKHQQLAGKCIILQEFSAMQDD